MSKFAEKAIDELNKLLELRSPDIHVNEVRKRGNKTKLGIYEYNLSDFDTQKMRSLENKRMRNTMVLKI